MQNSYLKFYLIFLSLALFSGCPYNPITPFVVDKNNIPPLGSVFSFEDRPLDSNSIEIDDSIFTSKDSVIATGLTLLGKTNVMHILYMNSKDSVTVDRFYNFESNGDISIFVPNPISKWVTLVFHNWNATTNIKLYDTSLGSFHFLSYDTIRLSSWNNNGLVPLFSNKYGIAYIDENNSTSISGSGISHIFYLNDSWLIVPKIGYFAIMGSLSRVGIPPFDQIQNLPNNRFERVLTAYSLK